ncbi:hypothetical protein ACFSC3_14990 [Sphingomonas floccifaciens]|uniref:Lipoprotein n=1 Tax=Sphingomonas floccifaciens TaxID=1844115 RepID=A0ABW4NFP3_9SPHN
MILRVVASVVLLAALASCPRSEPRVRALAEPDLETAAILRGLVRDPAESDIAGLYARNTDRICIVRRDAGYRLGATVDYGEGIGCSAAGEVSRSGTRLSVRLSDTCRFEAAFDGDRIVFPAILPDGCASLCRKRASFGAVDVARLSASGAEAATMRTADGRLPCS